MILFDLPRFVGNPYQYRVETQKEFLDFIRNNDGKAPCFTSHNAHPDNETSILRYIPYDFDSPDKPENAMNDALSLLDWSDERDLEIIFNFSGRQGFHAYQCFKPQKVARNSALKVAYEDLQITAREEAKLRTADKRVEGDPRRIMRIPNTLHTKSDLRAIPVPRELLERADVEEIFELAKTKQPTPTPPQPRETFAEAMQRLELKSSREGTKVKAAGKQTTPYKGNIPEFVKTLIPRPCIHSGLMENNPAHLIRFEACSHLVNVGYDLFFLWDFFNQVAEEAKWVDRHNAGNRNYQIEHIWRKGAGSYNPHSCHRVRAEGYCIGQECPMFEAHWPDEVDDD